MNFLTLATLLLCVLTGGCASTQPESANTHDAATEDMTAANDTPQTQKRPPPPAPAPPPGTARVTVQVQGCTEAPDGRNLCDLVVQGVRAYGMATPPLRVGEVLSVEWDAARLGAEAQKPPTSAEASLEVVLVHRPAGMGSRPADDAWILQQVIAAPAQD